MTNWFLDPVSGNNANSGVDFANRKLTLGSFGSLAAGDIIRVIGSPDPTSLSQTATFTNKSLTVTLSSAVTANITLCQNAWTAGQATVTCTTSATRKEGTLSVSNAVNVASVNGKLAYFATGTLDLSSYQQISFWIQSSAAVAANLLRIRLSTDTTGDTATHDFVINVALSASVWTRLTFNNASNMNSAIASIALVQDSTLAGTTTFLIDNIIACKATSSADSLTLNSLISKNTTNEVWYAIKSINGTAIVVDDSSDQGSGRGYGGTTEAITIWKRECLVASPQTASTNIQVLATNGTSGNQITISGGWDRTNMSTQSLNCSILMFPDINANIWKTTGNFSTFTNIGAVGGNIGFQFNGTDGVYDNLIVAGTASNPISMSGSARQQIGLNTAILIGPSAAGTSGLGSAATTVGTLIAVGLVGHGLSFSGLTEFQANNLIARNNTNDGFRVTANVSKMRISALTSKDNGAIGLDIQDNGTYDIWNFSQSGNGTSAYGGLVSGATLRMYYATAGTSGTVTVGNNNTIISHQEGSVATTNLIYGDGYTLISDISTVESPATFSWKFSPTNANINSSNPMTFLRPFKVFVKANKTLTFTCRARRDSTSITARIKIYGGRVAGVATNQTSTASGSINTWETLTVTATPAIDEWIEIFPEAYGGTTLNAWFGLCTAVST